MVEESLLLFEFSPCQLSVQQLMNNTNSLFCCLALGMFLNHSKLGIFFVGGLELENIWTPFWVCIDTLCSNSTTSLDFDLKEIYGVCQPPFCFTSSLFLSSFGFYKPIK